MNSGRDGENYVVFHFKKGKYSKTIVEQSKASTKLLFLQSSYLVKFCYYVTYFRKEQLLCDVIKDQFFRYCSF